MALEMEARESMAHSGRRSCQQCRRRKAKCDGRKPKCSRCLQLHDDCSYADKDGRTAVSKDYVRSLEDRIAVLENALRQRSQSHGDGRGVDSGGEADVSGPSTRPGRSSGREADTTVDAITDNLDRLRVDAKTHQLRQFGPTSTLQHLSQRSLVDPRAEVDVIPGPYYDPWIKPLYMPPVEDFSMMDWRRHLPALKNWDAAFHDSIIDLFFQNSNFYRLVNETRFRQELFTCLISDASSDVPDRTSYYSPVLHNAMLATACALSDDPRATVGEPSVTLLRAAQHKLFTEGDQPTLSTIAGVLLIGSHLTSLGKNGLGYTYVGMAIRMCHILGLNVDCSGYVKKGLLSPEDQDARNKLLWSLYLIDKLWSIYVGHESSLPRQHIQPNLPSTGMAPTRHGHAETSEDYPGAVLHWTIGLATRVEWIMSSLYGLRVVDIHSPAVMDQVSAMSLVLDKWFEDLPLDIRIVPQHVPPLDGHRIFLNLFYSYIQILLHRPYFTKQALEQGGDMGQVAKRRCTTAARRINSLLDSFNASLGLRVAPIAVIQFGSMACTIHILGAAIARESGQERESDGHRQAASDCINLVRQIGKPCRSSLQHAEMLERMLHPADATDYDVNTNVTPSANVEPTYAFSFSLPPFLPLWTPGVPVMPSQPTQSFQTSGLFATNQTGCISPGILTGNMALLSETDNRGSQLDDGSEYLDFSQMQRHVIMMCVCQALQCRDQPEEVRLKGVCVHLGCHTTIRYWWLVPF